MEARSPQAAIKIVEFVVVRRYGGNVGDLGARTIMGDTPPTPNPSR